MALRAICLLALALSACNKTSAPSEPNEGNGARASSPRPGSTQSGGTTATNPNQGKAAARLDAPEGFQMPKACRAHSSSPGGDRAAARWIGVFVGDPGDPAIAELLSKRTDSEPVPGSESETFDAGDACLQLYGNEVREAGAGTGWNGMDVSYAIQDGALQVICRSDEFHDDRAENSFSCYVSTPGG